MDPDGRFAMAFRKVLRRPQILVIPKSPIRKDVPDVNVIKFQKPHGSSCFPMKFSIKFSINEPFIPLQCLFLHGGRNFKARWAPDGSTVDQVARWQTEATPCIACIADVSSCSTMAHIKAWYSISFPKILGDFPKEIVSFSHPASCTGNADPGRRTNHELLDGMGLVPNSPMGVFRRDFRYLNGSYKVVPHS